MSVGAVAGFARRVRGLAAIACCAALGACGGGGQSPQACSGAACPKISGSYFEVVQGNNVDCGDLHRLFFGGGSDQVFLEENGSALQDDSGVGSLQGVLHTDGSATFGPVAAEAEPVDESGNPDPSGMAQPGKLYLAGWFVNGSFEGTYLFVADNDGCEIDAQTKWSR